MLKNNVIVIENKSYRLLWLGLPFKICVLRTQIALCDSSNIFNIAQSDKKLYAVPSKQKKSRDQSLQKFVTTKNFAI